jgi:enoyl-CoA hydratase/carnithine racemase
MRTAWDAELAAALDAEDSCWAATAFSADRKEGVAAFNDKRRPHWPGPEPQR